MLKKITLSLFALGMSALGAFAQTNPGITPQQPITPNDCAVWVSTYKLKSVGCSTIAPVTSVFGRTGNVIAQNNDYNFNQLAGQASGAQLPLPFTNGTASGNTNAFGTVTGALTSGNCVKFDANGNLVDAGFACNGGGTVANPTATIGLTAVNGVATSVMRSDAAPPLSQAIVPTWTGTHTFSPASGTTDKAVVINQAPSGTATSGTYYTLNGVTVSSDDMNVGGVTGAVLAWGITHNFGGSSAQGARIGNYTRVNLTAPTNAANATKEYVGVSGYAVAQSGDGGTNTGAGAAGAMFGANFVAATGGSSANMLGIIGGEVNTVLRTGSSSQRKVGWAIIDGAESAVAGALWDAALVISNQTGAVGWTDGILLGNVNGAFPIAASGNVMRATAGTVNHGIDLSALTCTTDCFKSNGFRVDGNGAVYPGTGTFAAGVAKMYTSGGALVLNMGSGGSVDFQLINPNGQTVIAATHSSNDITLGGASGHIRTASATPPALTSCGTSPTISGTDIAGEVVMGTGSPTGCVITFFVPYLNKPYCTVTWQSNLASMQYTTSTTAITLTQTATSSNRVNYRCNAQSGG